MASRGMGQTCREPGPGEIESRASQPWNMRNMEHAPALWYKSLVTPKRVLLCNRRSQKSIRAWEEIGRGEEGWRRSAYLPGIVVLPPALKYIFIRPGPAVPVRFPPLDAAPVYSCAKAILEAISFPQHHPIGV